MRYSHNDVTHRYYSRFKCHQSTKINAKKCIKIGVEMHKEFISTLLFADNQVILLKDLDNINYIIRKANGSTQ